MHVFWVYPVMSTRYNCQSNPTKRTSQTISNKQMFKGVLSFYIPYNFLTLYKAPQRTKINVRENRRLTFQRH